MESERSHQRPSSWLNGLAALLAVFVVPIAAPAWGIEAVMGRRRPLWQFNPYTATAYFVGLVVLASAALVYGQLPWRWAAAYVLTAMEVVAIWICVSLAVARPGHAYHLLKRYGRRRWHSPPRETRWPPAGLYMGIVSYLYTVYYFACVCSLAYGISAGTFDGVKQATALNTLWQFIYYSVVTVVTLGYGDIHPEVFATELLSVLEVLVGAFLLVFVFGSFVSFHVSRLSRVGQASLVDGTGASDSESARDS